MLFCIMDVLSNELKYTQQKFPCVMCIFFHVTHKSLGMLYVMIEVEEVVSVYILENNISRKCKLHKTS